MHCVRDIGDEQGLLCLASTTHRRTELLELEQCSLGGMALNGYVLACISYIVEVDWEEEWRIYSLTGWYSKLDSLVSIMVVQSNVESITSPLVSVHERCTCSFSHFPDGENSIASSPASHP